MLVTNTSAAALRFNWSIDEAECVIYVYACISVYVCAWVCVCNTLRKLAVRFAPFTLRAIELSSFRCFADDE